MRAKQNFKRLIVLRWVIVIACAVAVSIGVWYIVKKLDVNTVSDNLSSARIADIRPMVEMCSLEFYRDMPMRDSIGSKHIFARRKIEGQIRFDIDSLPVDVTADTIRVVLPRESLIVRESTDEGSYEIIDVWNTSVFGSSRLSNQEENIFKRRHDARIRRELYADGTVAKARRDAAGNVARMLSVMYRRPAMVIIPK